jgi:alpha/beta superfamily hydrolase
VAIEGWLTERPEIAQLYNLITFQMGSYLFVAVKARMRETQSASRLVAEINAVQDELKDVFPAVRWVFFEPDEKD